MIVRVFLGLLALQQLLDCWFTVLGILRGGTQAEGNPLIRTLIETFGIGSFVAVKLIIFSLLLLSIKFVAGYLTQSKLFRYLFYTGFGIVFSIYSVVLVIWFDILFLP